MTKGAHLSVVIAHAVYESPVNRPVSNATSLASYALKSSGGMNIGREYRYDWHDLMMEVSGPVVDKRQFESDIHKAEITVR